MFQPQHAQSYSLHRSDETITPDVDNIGLRNSCWLMFRCMRGEEFMFSLVCA
jgi:hypothetical protein